MSKINQLAKEVLGAAIYITRLNEVDKCQQAYSELKGSKLPDACNGDKGLVYGASSYMCIGSEARLQAIDDYISANILNSEENRILFLRKLVSNLTRIPIENLPY